MIWAIRGCDAAGREAAEPCLGQADDNVLDIWTHVFTCQTAVRSCALYSIIPAWNRASRSWEHTHCICPLLVVCFINLFFHILVTLRKTFLKIVAFCIILNEGVLCVCLSKVNVHCLRSCNQRHYTYSVIWFQVTPPERFYKGCYTPSSLSRWLRVCYSGLKGKASDLRSSPGSREQSVMCSTHFNNAVHLWQLISMYFYSWN